MPSSDLDVRLLVDAEATIGESPIWVAQEGALYWIDVTAPALYRTNYASGETMSWPLPSEVGGYALTRDGIGAAAGAVVGLRHGIFAADFSTKELTKLAEPPFDPETHRFNEGDCDSNGRLWLGTMFDPVGDGSVPAEDGYLYSFAFADGLTRHDDRSLLHNGFAWSGDNRHFIIAHSHSGDIQERVFDITAGLLGPKQPFASVPDALGVPDGGAFDAEGYYWSAIHGGGRLHRYAPGGGLDRVIELPIRNPTMLTFCGADLHDICITSASHGKKGEPHEGGVFLIMGAAVRGLSRDSRSLPRELKQKLKNDGFTNVQVVPSSFMVSAKDKNGDPVLMMIGPHSMTMLTEVPKSDRSTTGSGSDSASQDNSNQSNSK